MKSIQYLLALTLFLAVSFVQAADGLIKVKSPHTTKATMDKFEEIVASKGLSVFARVDHSAGAKSVGKALRPTEVLVFGNPQGGTPLMQCVQTLGIDLPLKALVWEDASSQVWLGYNDLAYLAERHAVKECPAVEKLSKALAAFAAATVEP